MHKVIIILNRLVIGGTAMNSIEMITGLKGEFDMVLISGALEEGEQAFHSDSLKNIRHIHISSLKRNINVVNDLRAFFKLMQIIKREKPDIVHTIGAKPGILGRLSAKICKVPVIIHAYHGHVFHSYFNPFLSRLVLRLERLAAAWATRIITVSEQQSRELSQVYRIAKPQKLVHIPIGIQQEKFADDHLVKRNAFRTKYLLTEEEVAVGIVGRIVPIKNHMLFLKVARKIAGIYPRTRFFIVGDGERLRKKLEEFLDANHMNHTYFPSTQRKALITFTSWVTTMDIVMAGLDIVVLTSLNEGTPVSVIEAQAAGKPVVSTNVGAIKEVMANDISGFVSDTNTIDDISDKLISLIRDKPLRENMGKAGKNFIVDQYTLSLQIENTRQLYSSLIIQSQESQLLSF